MACMDKKVVDLRKLAYERGVPEFGKLRTKRDLCAAIERQEAAQGQEQDDEEQGEAEVGDDDEEEERSVSAVSVEEPKFDFPTVKHATDQFHWQQEAVASKFNGYKTLNLPQGSTFWHGTNLLFPDGRLPLGVSFYGDIETARIYAKVRAQRDWHGFARVLSAVNTKPLAILKMSDVANVVRMRKRLEDSPDGRPYVALLDYAFPVSANGKQVERNSSTSHDAALNFGLQLEMMDLRVHGWCAVEMKRQNDDETPWHDEICFLHNSERPLLERGPEQLFVVPRYPHSLLHFHNGAFCGFLDARDANVKKPQKLAIDRDVDYKDVSADVRAVPEIAYAIQHRAQLDKAFLALADPAHHRKAVAAAAAATADAAKVAKVRRESFHKKPSGAFIDASVLEMMKAAATEDQQKAKAKIRYNNPLGLPPPSGGKLIDRNELIPKSFK